MEVFIGFITPFPWDWPPRSWALCQGQTQSIAQNNALFALIGTTYGGNGSTTFNLPDLRGRQIVGQGQGLGLSPMTIGEMAGTETVTLNSAQTGLLNHTHTAVGGQSLQVSTAAAASATPILQNGDVAYLANAAAGSAGNALKGLYTTTAPTQGAIATVPVSGAFNLSPAGSPVTAQVPLRNPYLALNFSIALFGIYPSRN